MIAVEVGSLFSHFTYMLVNPVLSNCKASFVCMMLFMMVTSFYMFAAVCFIQW